MFSVYERYLLPRIVHRSMSYGPLGAYRQRTVSQATGRVLEIGVGSGRNLPFYGPAVQELVGVDPSSPLLARARAQARHGGVPARLLEASAEALPFEGASFDSAVVTWSLCSIPDPARALAEVRRVLRPGGQLLFVEHGRSPDANVAAWQDRLTPLWARLSGGCHLNRAPEDLLKDAGFQLGAISTGYLGRPKLFTWMVEGTARAA